MRFDRHRRKRLEIVRDALYSAALFDYDEDCVARIAPAIELGRSFVAPAWQRSFASLMLLWKGIGAYVTRHPRYHNLLGSVGIHDSYSPMSRELMVAYATSNALDRRLADLVRARSPFAVTDLLPGELRERALASLDELSESVAEFEPDGKGVPVLMRHYLKLGGEFLGFHADSAFNSLACLTKVDLLQTEQRTLEFYLGRREARDYLAFHHGPRQKIA